MLRLCYKAWRESRSRFLGGATIIGFFCLNFVQRTRLDFPPPREPWLNYTTYVWRGIYDGPLVPMFVLLVLVLGLGGLRRELALGTAPFTLAIPISRARLVAARAVVGVLQVAMLSAIPVLI